MNEAPMTPPSAAHVLIVEDEPRMAALLADYLQASGYTSAWLANGLEVVPSVKARRPDLVLLDLMLPGQDGMSVCRALRLFSDVPVIMLTARVEEADRLMGLEIGADDYICKTPFSPREVVARVKALLRRSGHSAREVSALQIDAQAYKASWQGAALDLTPIEFRLLKALIEKIEEDCAIAGIKPAAPNTIRARIEEIEEKKRAKKRKGEAEARKFEANKKPGRGNKLPDADYPLAVGQMDHTLLDIMVVDDKHRKPIRRAWITVLIDCYSRVIQGFYVSLDPPSSLSAGLCITNAVLTKRRRLEQLGVTNQVEWPYYGVMDVVHMDNAKEFRGKLIEFGCKEYHIDAHFRPVKNPKYGAIIERFMGTLASKIKALPGATFSNPKERGEYDSEKTASMTLTELETWLYLTIEKYHLEKHSTLGMPPALKWKEGILGTKTKPGRGRPALIQDEEKLRIDLLPFEERVIHPEGVVIKYVTRPRHARPIFCLSANRTVGSRQCWSISWAFTNRLFRRRRLPQWWRWS